MCEVGAWKNFYDLEDSLTIEELMELYDSSVDRQMRLVRTIGSALGAEFEDTSNGGDYSLPKPDADVVYDQYDLQQLPFGIGYGSMS